MVCSNTCLFIRKTRRRQISLGVRNAPIRMFTIYDSVMNDDAPECRGIGGLCLVLHHRYFVLSESDEPASEGLLPRVYVCVCWSPLARRREETLFFTSVRAIQLQRNEREEGNTLKKLPRKASVVNQARLATSKVYSISICAP